MRNSDQRDLHFFLPSPIKRRRIFFYSAAAFWYYNTAISRWLAGGCCWRLSLFSVATLYHHHSRFYLNSSRSIVKIRKPDKRKWRDSTAEPNIFVGNRIFKMKTKKANRWNEIKKTLRYIIINVRYMYNVHVTKGHLPLCFLPGLEGGGGPHFSLFSAVTPVVDFLFLVTWTWHFQQQGANNFLRKCMGKLTVPHTQPTKFK